MNPFLCKVKHKKTFKVNNNVKNKYFTKALQP